MKKLIASALSAVLLTAIVSLSFATTTTDAEGAIDNSRASEKTIGCYSIGTPCDRGGTCCSTVCLHHKCVAN